MGRIDKAIKNSVVGIISFILITLATFVSRRVFANMLGAEYLGLLGLFTDILAMISLSEMGIFAISVFYLYKPLAENNYKEVNRVLSFSKRVYNYIALIVLIVGLGMMFFIGKIAKGTIPINNVRWYYLLSVINSVVSYLLYYKQTLLVADQKNFVISIIHGLCKLSAIVLQVMVLTVFKSFYGYLLVQIIITMAENISCSIIVGKKYPYVHEKSSEKLDKDTKNDIVKRTKALFITRISSFIIYSTDNIIISSFINIAQVGIYGNYILVISMIKTFFSQIFAAFTTGFGNMIAKKEKEQAYIVFKASLFFAFCFSCISCTIIISLIQTFISLWLGSKFLLSFPTVCLIVICLFNALMDVPVISAQNAAALHYKDEKVMFVQIFTNIILSLIFVNKMGIFGVVLGNLLSNIFLPTISKPYVVYKYIFEKSPSEYYKDYLKYTGVALIVAIMTTIISRRFFYSVSFLALIEITMLSITLSCITIFVLYRRTDGYKYCINVVRKMLNR